MCGRAMRIEGKKIHQVFQFLQTWKHNFLYSEFLQKAQNNYLFPWISTMICNWDQKAEWVKFSNQWMVRCLQWYQKEKKSPRGIELKVWIKKRSLQQLQKDFRRIFCVIFWLFEADCLRLFNIKVWKWIICLLPYVRYSFTRTWRGN